MRRLMTMTLAFAAAFSPLAAAEEHPQEQKANKGPVKRPAMHAEMADALNNQLKLEMESAYIYLGMSTYFSEQGLDGFAHWYYLHAQEELQHAMKVHDFMLGRGVHIEYPELVSPSTKWESPVDVLEASLTHEIFVSQTIKNMYALAQELQEYDAGEFVLWFLREQVEEESLFESVLNRLYMLDDQHPAGLLLIDMEMAKRQN